MKAATRVKTNPAVEQPLTSLRLSGLSERLRSASLEHDKLVARVARKRGDLDRLRAEAHAAMSAVAGRVQPLAEEWKGLDLAIHGLFDELLGGKRSRRAKSQIRVVYLDLQEAGVISERSEIDDSAIDEPWPDFGAPLGDEPLGRGTDDARHPPTPSAHKNQDRGALRDLYRRLVELLHPDQVQDESDKARRTEAMKDVTVAYRDSDFGRLIEIERAWVTSSPPLRSEDEVERRLSAVEAQNRELKKQLRALEREVRAFRRSPEGQVVREVHREGPGGRDQVAAHAVEEVEGELRRVREVHDFVAAFRDGKIEMEEFLAGPALSGQDDDDDEFAETLDESFADFLRFVEQELATTEPGSRGRRSGRKRGRKRS